MNVMLIEVNCHLSLISTALCDKVITGHIFQMELVVWKQQPKPVLWVSSSKLKKWEWTVNRS